MPLIRDFASNKWEITIYERTKQSDSGSKNLRVSYHTYAGEVKAVRGVQFSLEKGQALAIVGESGCGKSVTAKSIMGLIKGPAG